MFSMEWWLGLTPEPDPARMREQLSIKIDGKRALLVVISLIIIAAGWNATTKATRPIHWEQLSFALCWGLLVMLALIMPNIAGHTGWPAARRRLIVWLVWLTAVLLVLAGAWDFALFNDRRWGVFFAWLGLFMGFGIGLMLLGLMAWFALAGRQLAELVTCSCPPPIKRWMRRRGSQVRKPRLTSLRTRHSRRCRADRLTLIAGPATPSSPAAPLSGALAPGAYGIGLAMRPGTGGTPWKAREPR
jgi:hypothetical protein